MSQFVTELPKVIIKPGHMLTSAKLKVVLVLLALLLYVYILLFIKTFYLKSKRLDRILEMALETEKQLLNVHTMDQRLVMKMSEIEKIYEDYWTNNMLMCRIILVFIKSLYILLKQCVTFKELMYLASGSDYSFFVIAQFLHLVGFYNISVICQNNINWL